MAIYVLVHGGGHGGWCYKSVARLLAAAGHEVYAPTLTGLADRAHLLRPDTGLDTHIDDITRLLEFQDLSDVILVGHSYGGMVITGTADRARERIAQLVYLDAAIPCDGEALVDVSPGLLRLAGTTRMMDGVELGLWPDDPQTTGIYGLAGSPHEAWAMARLTPHPWKTVTDRLRLERPIEIATIPRTIINCPCSLANRPDGQRHRWLQAERVWEIDTSHAVMLTEPERVAAMLGSLAI